MQDIACYLSINVRKMFAKMLAEMLGNEQSPNIREKQGILKISNVRIAFIPVPQISFSFIFLTQFWLLLLLVALGFFGFVLFSVFLVCLFVFLVVCLIFFEEEEEEEEDASCLAF